MKSSFQSPIPFLPLFCNCQFRRLDSIPHIPAGWRLETRLFSSDYSTTLLYSVASSGCVLLYPLGTDPTEKAASVFKEACLLIHCLSMDILILSALAFAGMCLPSCCLPMGIHITILTRISHSQTVRCFLLLNYTAIFVYVGLEILLCSGYHAVWFG
jgi:hypothetical protein